ncbi:MAG: valine--tRNA ligase [Anaerolineae bacterium]|nr:valine--tRNA ligase [Anaerolineae bacterium]
MTDLQTSEMPKTFDFAEAEPRLYRWWKENGWFKPEIHPDAEPFVISIPPPNVTGALHNGHAMFVSIEDLMIRYERMRGKAALWVPGADHAGIATQLQVENMLRGEGTSRQEIGRDEFLRRTWEWKAKYGGRIVEQLRRIGASCDWDRERFTLDDGLSRAVREAFVALWEQGLIYRGPRLINWSPGLQTAVSDLEVERAEEQGHLYYFNYPVEGGGSVPVATTRPETILGDTAVAVHPDDERYQALIGKQCLVPMLDRPIPIIADAYVDREFGTGALKITPGHDPNDYEIGQRHNLAIVNIMNQDATLNENAGPYAGLDRFDARKKLWADMEAAGMTLRVEPHAHVVPRSQRGGEIVEPLVSTQWFVKIQPLAEKATAAVRDGRITIVPDHFEKVYYNWLDNIQDWCISRQLWWGHRIPAWHCADCHQITVAREDPTTCAHCGSQNLHQDADVLDTWFSSGLWPFSTLGWPENTPDLQRYYPTSMMETGYDILFFWVARMIMLGLWFTDDAPFHTVYLHGLVRDEHGRKMSKTYGNVIDPLEIIAQYGADPLRFTLLTGSSPGNDMNLSESRIEYSRNFGNKLWQMSRFVWSNLDGFTPGDDPDPARLDLPSRWILSRLTGLVANVQRLFDTFQYSEAGRQILEFLWGEFADWYVEISKNALYGDDVTHRKGTLNVLLYVLNTSLRLLHPYIPHITEEIWHYLPTGDGPLITAEWPQANPAYENPGAEADFSILAELVRGIRNARAEYKVEPARRISASIAPGTHRDFIDTHRDIFSRLCNVADITLLASDADVPDKAATIVADDVTIYLPLADLIDLDAERARLQGEMENLTTQITRTDGLLQNESFVSKAKPEVVQRERDKLTSLMASRQAVEERLASLTD